MVVAWCAELRRVGCGWWKRWSGGKRLWMGIRRAGDEYMIAMYKEEQFVLGS